MRGAVAVFARDRQRVAVLDYFHRCDEVGLVLGSSCAFPDRTKPLDGLLTTALSAAVATMDASSSPHFSRAFVNDSAVAGALFPATGEIMPPRGDSFLVPALCVAPKMWYPLTGLPPPPTMQCDL